MVLEISKRPWAGKRFPTPVRNWSPPVLQQPRLELEHQTTEKSRSPSAANITGISHLLVIGESKAMIQLGEQKKDHTITEVLSGFGVRVSISHKSVQGSKGLSSHPGLEGPSPNT